MSKNNSRDVTFDGSGYRVGRRGFLSGLGWTAATAALLPLAGNRFAFSQDSGATPPEFSLAERDRRWDLLRNLMWEQKLDCLIIPHAAGDSHLMYANWISNVRFGLGPGAIVFPQEGAPVIFGTLPAPGRWIEEVGPKWHDLGDQILEKVRELGLADRRIGVIGTRSRVVGLNEFANEGLWNFASWNTVVQGLPGADITDITPQLAELFSVKGIEEIRAAELAAEVGEELHAMMLEAARPGTSDLEFRSKIAEFLALQQASADVQSLEINPGRMANGDVINSEYGINYGGGYAQVTLCIAVGEVSAETRLLEEAAQSCFQAGLASLKPGVTFGSVIENMESTVKAAGYWHGFPVLHCLRPMFMVGPVANFPPPFVPSRTLGADSVIKEGMVFSFEPGARRGDRAQVKLGSTGVVTGSGVRLFNRLGTRLQQV